MLKFCKNCNRVFKPQKKDNKFCCVNCFRLYKKKESDIFLSKNPYKKRIMKIFQKMKERCYYEKDISYKNYGGRGIKICDEWINNRQAFYIWSLENGYEDDLSIDRVDANKNYCPENCRWVTKKQQNRNTRKNIFLECEGEKHCIGEWAEILGFTEKLLWQKLHRDKKTLKEIIKKIEKNEKNCLQIQ